MSFVSNADCQTFVQFKYAMIITSAITELELKDCILFIQECIYHRKFQLLVQPHQKQLKLILTLQLFMSFSKYKETYLYTFPFIVETELLSFAN